MKIICNTSILAEAAMNVQKAVMTKTTMPILEGILLSTTENGLKLTGYDLEIGIGHLEQCRIRPQQPGEGCGQKQTRYHTQGSNSKGAE